MDSGSSTQDDDPEDPDDSNGTGRASKRKKKKNTEKEKGKRSRRSHKSKAIATSKIVVNLAEFRRKDLIEFAEYFGRFLRMTGHTHANGRVKCDLLLQCCNSNYPEKQVKHIVTKFATFADVLVALER